MMKIKNNMIFLFNQSLDKYSANSAKELKPQEVEILSAMVNKYLFFLYWWIFWGKFNFQELLQGVHFISQVKFVIILLRCNIKTFTWFETTQYRCYLFVIYLVFYLLIKIINFL